MVSEAWRRRWVGRPPRQWWLCLLGWIAICSSLVPHYQSAHTIFERLVDHCKGSGELELESGEWFAQTVVILVVVVFASMVEWMARTWSVWAGVGWVDGADLCVETTTTDTGTQRKLGTD